MAKRSLLRVRGDRERNEGIRAVLEKCEVEIAGLNILSFPSPLNAQTLEDACVLESLPRNSLERPFQELHVFRFESEAPTGRATSSFLTKK